MNTYAFIVGIETYGEKDYTVQGPCANAIAVARWLLEIGTPGKNIHIFLNPGDRAPNIDDLHKAEVHHHGSATKYQIDDFWKKELAKDCPSDSRLFVFWSGHGGTGPDRRRLLLCHDYDAVMNDRFFDITNFLEHLKTPPFQCFNDQIALVDVCGVYLNHPVGVQPDPAPKLKTHQLAYFASPEGCYAAGEEGRGVFTNAALSVLKSLPDGWPVQKQFAHDLCDHLGALKAPGFRIGGFYDGVEHPETVVGIIPAPPPTLPAHPLEGAFTINQEFVNTIRNGEKIFQDTILFC